MNTLLTIGYEGSTIGDFIATLKVADVDLLVDIRDVPVSRKAGFSKNSLRGHLENAGIAYRHMRELGDPKPGREAARRGDTETFQRIFRTHLAGDHAQRALESLSEVLAQKKCCLLCFERNHSQCHRTIVANELSLYSILKVQHIGVRHGLSSSSTNKMGAIDGALFAVG